MCLNFISTLLRWHCQQLPVFRALARTWCNCTRGQPKFKSRIQGQRLHWRSKVMNNSSAFFPQGTLCLVNSWISNDSRSGKVNNTFTYEMSYTWWTNQTTSKWKGNPDLQRVTGRLIRKPEIKRVGSFPYKWLRSSSKKFDCIQHHVW